jgi:hypothetical protein
MFVAAIFCAHAKWNFIIVANRKRMHERRVAAVRCDVSTVRMQSPSSGSIALLNIVRAECHFMAASTELNH